MKSIEQKMYKKAVNMGSFSFVPPNANAPVTADFISG